MLSQLLVEKIFWMLLCCYYVDDELLLVDIDDCSTRLFYEEPPEAAVCSRLSCYSCQRDRSCFITMVMVLFLLCSTLASCFLPLLLQHSSSSSLLDSILLLALFSPSMRWRWFGIGCQSRAIHSQLGVCQLLFHIPKFRSNWQYLIDILDGNQ